LRSQKRGKKNQRAVIIHRARGGVAPPPSSALRLAPLGYLFVLRYVLSVEKRRALLLLWIEQRTSRRSKAKTQVFCFAILSLKTKRMRSFKRYMALDEIL
jgi:hypothetical protein